jgi:hypothetical protein
VGNLGFELPSEHFIVVAFRHGFIFSSLFLIEFQNQKTSISSLENIVRGDRKLAGKLVTASSLKKGRGSNTVAAELSSLGVALRC